MIKNGKINLIYKIFSLIVTLLTVGLNLFNTSDSLPNRFVMFTIDSNVIIMLFFLLYFICLIFKIKMNTRWFKIIQFIAVTSIALTFIIFGAVLTPLALITGKYNPFTLNSIFAHFIAPIFMIVDYIFFTETKNYLKKYEFFYGLIFPVVYYIIMMIRGQFINGTDPFGSGGKYPYFFMDPEMVGYWFEGGTQGIHFGIFPFLICFILLLTLICYLLYFIRKKQDKKRETGSL